MPKLECCPLCSAPGEENGIGTRAQCSKQNGPCDWAAKE